ncbi:MAG: 30S ribosomal protein S7 [Endomicrobiales bacterium]|nr:30S ribosomal protein S7 [Endomicrobiales bacterium]
MSRKEIKPRERRSLPPPDSRCNSVLVARFINKLDSRGKRSTAERVFYGALDIIKEKTGEDPVVVFNRAMENARPLLEVRPRRVGGATYQVPMEVPPVRSTALAMKWFISYAKSRKGKPMSDRLAQEFMDASRKEGSVIKKREDTHRMAESNKAFAHYRW